MKENKNKNYTKALAMIIYQRGVILVCSQDHLGKLRVENFLEVSNCWRRIMEDENLFLIVQILQQSKIIISIIIKKNRQLRFEALQNI